MVTALAFLAAAAAGAVTRLVLREALDGRALPWGTLAVNLTGSFALGLSSALTAPLSTILAVGGIGAVTTFSTLAAELVTGWDEDRSATILYLAISLSGGVGAAWTGMAIAP